MTKLIFKGAFALSVALMPLLAAFTPLLNSSGQALHVGVQPACAVPGLLSGQVQRENVDNLVSQIHWFDNLEQAKESARQTGKMVFYMHMLGNLSGST